MVGPSNPGNGAQDGTTLRHPLTERTVQTRSIERYQWQDSEMDTQSLTGWFVEPKKGKKGCCFAVWRIVRMEDSGKSPLRLGVDVVFPVC